MDHINTKPPQATSKKVKTEICTLGQMQFQQKRKRFQVAAIYFDLIMAVQYGKIGFGEKIKHLKSSSLDKKLRTRSYQNVLIRDYIYTALNLYQKNVGRFRAENFE